MEANGLHNSACAEAAENGKQPPNCLSSQNRGDGASGREKTAGQNKLLLGSDYQDFGLVLAQPNGRPYERRQIERMLDVFIEENDLRKVVFHSLRHSSTSIKLQISCGNIKAVQADTGHAQARMVTEVYAHTNNEERQLLAQKVDEKFFQKPLLEAAPPASEMQKVLQILAEKPELMKLLAAM